MRRSLLPLLAVLLACEPPPPSPPEPPPAPASAPHAPQAGGASVAVALDAGAPEAARAPLPEVLLSDAATMRALGATGYDLGTLLGDAPAPDAAALARGAHYADVARAVEDDVRRARKADSHAGVGLAFAHRLLDVRFLRAATSRWELTGVAERFDRDFVDPSHCGELRFLFRLRYDKTVKGLAISSRLPATAAVTFWNAVGATPDVCVGVMKDWEARAADPHHPSLWKPAELAPRFKSVELNVQTVRWPSTVRGDMAGHAEYALRSLVRSPDGKHLVAGTLENTPDVDRAFRDRAFRAALLAWVVDPDNAPAIDAGKAVLPARFLATHATSVTPHGLDRLHNRPFRSIFAPSEARPMPGAAFARSGEGVLRRLDEMSCPGCHSSRSVAGFHFLGEETAPAESVNAILVGRSPHLIDEIARRRAELARRTGSGGPVRPVPFAERTSARGERGAHCGLGGDPTFASWTCAKGLVCTPDVGTDGVGVCLAPATQYGDPCEVGTLDAQRDPHRDRVSGMKPRACGGACDDNRVGFPDGDCVGSCAGLGPDATCAAIPQLVSFNGCLASARGTSFEDCIRHSATPAAVQACGAARPCRDDYICARTPAGSGACMPPYFLFQLRVDGHP